MFLDLDFEALYQSVLDFLPRLGLGILVFAIAWLVSVWLARGLRRTLERRGIDQELIVLVRLVVRWGMLAIGIVVALEQIAPGRFGSLIAGLGIAGFTIGFALQDVAKNFIAGILLLLQQPFEIGDTIRVAGFEGKVAKIALRATEIRSVDGLYVIIPNGDVFISPIVNLSRAQHRRLELTVGVSYESDLDRVARVAVEALNTIEGMLQDPAPQIIFSNFGGTTVDFTAYYWVDTEVIAFLNARDAGYKVIKAAFEREGIEMPFPTQSILLSQNA